MAGQTEAVRLMSPSSQGDWADGRRLVGEYIDSLGVDLSFQGLEEELAHFTDEYGPPTGAFLLAEMNGVRVGCAGLRRFSADVGEMKRLYVTPGGRGRGLGRMLAARIVATARELGYGRLVLDTLPLMVEARELYRTMGFVATEPYRFNPVVGTAFLELDLS